MIMDDKYVELLISKCTNLENNKCLFINYNKEIKDFVLKIVSYAKSIGVSDIYLDEEDIHYTHDLLGEVTVSEGHSALVVGIDNDYYYVAESLWISPLGVNINKYKKGDVHKYFETVNLMDSYYKKQGNYTAMWY